MARRTAPTRVLGIMSGTSLDGVDCALCAITPRRSELLQVWSTPFSLRLRRKLERVARGEATSWELAQAHHDLGRFYAAVAVAQPAPSTGSGRGPRQRPELIGLHGQTVFHNPAWEQPATLQLGEPSYLAETFRVPVVSNFRAGDLAVGGQGAPLATMFHLRVFGQEGRHVCVNNLGGISNVTSIHWPKGGAPRVKAFDTGPGNMLIDMLARKLSGSLRALDQDGKRAAAGTPCGALLEAWMQHPFFARRPPKSTGREMFGEKFFEPAWTQMRERQLSPKDMLATVTELTARSLAFNYGKHLGGKPDVVILAGGGSANGHLRGRIEAALRAHYPRVSVAVTEDFGWPRASVEAAAFALLAWLRMRGEPGNVPGTTGAKRAVRLGSVTEVG